MEGTTVIISLSVCSLLALITRYLSDGVVQSGKEVRANIDFNRSHYYTLHCLTR